MRKFLLAARTRALPADCRCSGRRLRRRGDRQEQFGQCVWGWLQSGFQWRLVEGPRGISTHRLLCSRGQLHRPRPSDQGFWPGRTERRCQGIWSLRRRDPAASLSRLLREVGGCTLEVGRQHLRWRTAFCIRQPRDRSLPTAAGIQANWGAFARFEYDGFQIPKYLPGPCTRSMRSGLSCSDEDRASTAKSLIHLAIFALRAVELCVSRVV